MLRPLIITIVLAATCLVVTPGCRTIPRQPAVNLHEPGWILQQGQAVWRSKRGAPEIAGELLVARHPDGRTLLQFTKGPLPFVAVQTSGAAWQIDFAPQSRSFSGRGSPTPRLAWVHLARALAGTKPRAPLQFDSTGGQDWKLENADSGEMIAGFLGP